METSTVAITRNLRYCNNYLLKSLMGETEIVYVVMLIEIIGSALSRKKIAVGETVLSNSDVIISLRDLCLSKLHNHVRPPL